MDNSLISKKSYNSIDVFKFVFSFAVVAIHTNPLVNCNIEFAVRFVNSVTSLAVPFFFLASGFFLGNKLSFEEAAVEDDSKAIKKYIARITKMYLLWMLIYTPLAIIHYAKEGLTFFNALFRYVVGLIITGEQYNNWVLWYLLSTIYAAIIIFAMIRCVRGGKIRNLVILALISSVIVATFTWIGSYNLELSGVLLYGQKIVRNVFSSGRIFNGLVYLPIGIILSKKSITMSLNYVMFILGFILSIFLTDNIASTVLLIPTSIGLFGIIENLSYIRGEFSKLRKMSTIIYLIHLYVWTCYYMILYGKKTYGIDHFIVVAIVSTLIALLGCHIKERRIHNKKSL